MKNYYVYVNQEGKIADFEVTTDKAGVMADHCAEYNKTETQVTGNNCFMIVNVKDGEEPRVGEKFLDESERLMSKNNPNITESGLNDLDTTLKVLYALHQTIKSTQGIMGEKFDKKMEESIMIVGGLIARLARASRDRYEAMKNNNDKSNKNGPEAHA